MRVTLIALTVITSSLYLVARIALFLQTDYLPLDRVVAAILLLAELFILVHSFGYFLNLLAVSKRSSKGEDSATRPAPLRDFPPVAVVVASFKEPIEVVEDTLICFRNLTYPNLHVYFLDDTKYEGTGAAPSEYRSQVESMCQTLAVDLFRRSWRGAKAGMLNDFLSFLEGKREGFQVTPYGTRPPREEPKYLVVFDADMNPFPDFVEPLVSLLEADPRLAFIQTPQYYTNFENNRVARASSLQQVVFYEYICEGKSLKDAMMCCGTNVIFRVAALRDVGGLEELSVTEDFATSLKFHLKGWRSLYSSRVTAFGMGPEDLPAFFKQQYRWALGTVGLLRTIISAFVRQPKALPFGIWWEYFISGSYYLIGWVFLVIVSCPLLYNFFGIPSRFGRTDLYFMFFIPYLLLAFLMFFLTLKWRKYSVKQLFLGILLIQISFPIYARASILGLLGIKGKFTVTPKGGGSSAPLVALLPQLLLALICFIGAVWGAHRAYYEGENEGALLLNSFWCLYFFLVLGGVMYFNNPNEVPRRP